MSKFSLSQDDNFNNMSFGTWGFRRIVSGSTPVAGEIYRAVQVLEDAIISVTSNFGSNLTSQVVSAGTVIFGEFSAVSCSAGTVLAYKARP
jgi:hypothetical protein